MYGIERQEKILSLLSENVSISVNKLSKLLYVSQPTVRRDLSELERQKKVIRTHGGVVIRNAPDNEIPLLWREEQNNASKKKISGKAAGYIHNGDIIFMDASSTVSYIIPHLKSFTSAAFDCLHRLRSRSLCFSFQCRYIFLFKPRLYRGRVHNRFLRGRGVRKKSNA